MLKKKGLNKTKKNKLLLLFNLGISVQFAIYRKFPEFVRRGAFPAGLCGEFITSDKTWQPQVFAID